MAFRNWRRLAAALLIGSIFLSAQLAVAEDDGVNPELVRLYQYKPIYFIAGNPYAKIQISVKGNVIRDVPLYFAYSQLMLWDCFIASPRMEDMNYNPELFYRFHLNQAKGEWLDYGIFEHESNGKGGAGEVSWDRIYLRYHTRTDVGDTEHLHWELKAWLPLRYNKNNRDLAMYRGLYEASVSLSGFFPSLLERGDLTLRIYSGGPSLVDPLRGGQELTLRGKLGFIPVLPFIIGQIFHGYGENLSDYKQDRWGIRAGFGF